MTITIVTPDQDEIVSEIQISAPPERVFQALIDEAQLMRWFAGDSSCPVKFWKLDPRKGGKYHYHTAKGTHAVNGVTEFANGIPRVFRDDTPEDKKAIQPVINQIVAYPLKEYDGKMKTIDWSAVPTIPGPKATGEETKWVAPEKFFDPASRRSSTAPGNPGS